MAVDPNCSGDRAIWAQDGSPMWMSEDIRLNYGTPSQDVGQPGVVNNLAVRVRLREPGYDSGATGADLQLFVCIPSPTMSPTVNSFQILQQPGGGSGFIPRSATPPTPTLAGPPPDEEWEPYEWMPSSDPDHPGGPGHKCLLARVKQRKPAPGYSFDPNSFYSVEEDDHYVQRNICVAPCPNPEEPPPGVTVDERGGCGFDLTVLNPDLEQDAAIRLRTKFEPDLLRAPALRRSLKAQIKGIRDVVPKAPVAVGVEFEDKRAEVEDRLEGRKGSIDAHLRLKPLEVVKWRVKVNLSKTPRRVPVPIAVTQDYPKEDPARELPPGGITVAFVRV